MWVNRPIQINLISCVILYDLQAKGVRSASYSLPPESESGVPGPEQRQTRHRRSHYHPSGILSRSRLEAISTP